MQKYYTPEELAQQFKLNRMTIYRLLRSGDIPSVRIGKSYRVSENHLQNWLTDQKTAIRIPKVVDEWIRLLRQAKEVGEKIILVILFGSHARGTAHENSDIDLLMVERGMTEKDHELLLDLLTEAEIACEDDISLITRTTDEWEKMHETRSGLYQQLFKEGYALWPNQTPLNQLIINEPSKH